MDVNEWNSYRDNLENTLRYTYEMRTFEEFSECVNSDTKCCGFTDGDIFEYLEPFVKALQRKGFRVYVDEPNEKLIIVFPTMVYQE